MRDRLVLQLRARREIRRMRAIALDLRHPTEWARSRREAEALWQAHPGLVSDLSSLAVPNGRRYLVVSLNDRLRQVRLEAILAKALQLRGAQVDVLTFRSMRSAIRGYRSLGVRSLVYWEDFAGIKPDRRVELADVLARCRTADQLKSYEYRHARVGRQALSTVMRARYQPRIDLDDAATSTALAQTLDYAIEAVETAERILDEVRPDALLMIERGYAGLGSIFDVALSRGIKVIQFGSAHRDDAFFLKRYSVESRDLHPRSLEGRTWDRLLAGGWTQERKRALEDELAAREAGKWFIARHVRHSARRRGSERLRRDLGLDPKRKVAVLFSHVLWDAALFYGRDLYPDPGRWFEETVRLAAESPEVQWLVKLHPALHWKLNLEGIREEPSELRMIRDAVGELPAHMRLVLPDDDVDNNDLLGIVDAGVTIRGTIGIELPRLGIPVVTAGTSDYAGRGFTVDPADRAEYERTIREIGRLARLSPEQTRLANLYAYGVFCVRPWRFDSFTLDYGSPETDALEQELHYHVGTLEELEQAQDLRAFAEWVDESDDPDFVDAAALEAETRAAAR